MQPRHLMNQPMRRFFGFFSHFGAIFGVLGTIFGHSNVCRTIFGHFRAIFGVFGTIFDHFPAISGHFSTISSHFSAFSARFSVIPRANHFPALPFRQNFEQIDLLRRIFTDRKQQFFIVIRPSFDGRRPKNGRIVQKSADEPVVGGECAGQGEVGNAGSQIGRVAIGFMSEITRKYTEKWVKMAEK
jgi:hypothetical protein